MYGDLSNVRILTLDPAKDPDGEVIQECVKRSVGIKIMIQTCSIGFLLHWNIAFLLLEDTV